MLSKTLLILGAVATGYVSAAPAISSRSPGSQWTIHNFVRACDDALNTCLYTYSIDENDGSPSTICNYTITGSPNLSARVTNYQALLGCASHAYSLNQGWDDAQQFETLVVTNATSQFRAFYGFAMAQLGDGVVQADQTSPSTSSGVMPAKRGVGLEERQSSGWTVRGFTWESFDPLSSTYHFTLDNGPNTFDCTVINAPSSAQVSFGNVPCAEDGGHLVSWGYNSEGFAVMTVADYTLSPASYALFGYSNVVSWSSGATSPDVGPNPPSAT